MYQGRFAKLQGTAKQPHRRKKLNKFFLVTLSLVLLLGIAGGATLAYIVAGGGTVENSFAPGKVACTVQDDQQVQNTGNVPVFIRAAVVINWENGDGDINGIPPVEGTDYEITLGQGWSVADGFYYYNGAVESLELIPSPVTVAAKGNAPSGFHLSLEILAEAIQAEGMGATDAKDAWAKAKNGS